MTQSQSPRFNDGKDPEALRPMTRAGGRRYYRAEDVALLVEIDRLLHREGYTIRGARQALSGKARRPAVSATPVPEPLVSSPPVQRTELDDNLLAALTVLRGHLQGLRDRLASAIAT